MKTQAIENAQKGMNIVDGNIARLNVSGASRATQILTQNVRGGIASIESSVMRVDDPQLRLILRNNVTKASYAEQLDDYFSSLNVALGVGDTKDGPKSRIVTAVDSFITSPSSLVTDDPVRRQLFVSKGQELASSFLETARAITTIEEQAKGDLGFHVEDTNRLIKKIFDLNKTLRTNNLVNTVPLLDERDVALNELAENLGLNEVRFGKNGEALVLGKDGGLSIVDRDRYAQLRYNLLLGTVEVFYVLPNEVETSVVTKIDDGATVGGKIGACQEFIKNVPQLLDSVNQLKEVVSTAINKIHNDGCPFPPKTKFEGKELVTFSDNHNWKGRIKCTAVNGDGTALLGSSGSVRPIIIDLENLPTDLGNGRLSTADFMNELNQVLYSSMGTQRLALGQLMQGDPAVAIADTYLVNDIKLVGNSNINPDGSFTFSLDLDGNEYFGSQVQILGVSGAVISGVPQSFRLEKGEHKRFGTISLAGIIGAQNIDVQIQIIGDNGLVSNGTARFAVNSANPQMLNQRVIGAVQAGDMQLVVPPTSPPIATAKLVDENGGVINITDTTRKGRLVIETIDGNVGLIIESSDSEEANSGESFGQFFGLNNFFDKDKLGNLQVREDILLNADRLSANRISSRGTTAKVLTGLMAATATMQFGANPADGNTVTIAGVAYTFRNAPALANDVQIDGGASLTVTLQNLANMVNANNMQPVSVSVTAANTITITAKKSGTSSNLLAVASSVAININGTGGLNNGTLAGGTDMEIDCELSRWRVGKNAQVLQEFAQLNTKLLKFKGSDLVPSGEATMYNIASLTGAALAEQVSTAKHEAEVTKRVTDETHKKLIEVVGITKENQWSEMMKWTEQSQLNLYKLKQDQKMFDNIIAALG